MRRGTCDIMHHAGMDRHKCNPPMDWGVLGSAMDTMGRPGLSSTPGGDQLATPGGEQTNQKGGWQEQSPTSRGQLRDRNRHTTKGVMER